LRVGASVSVSRDDISHGCFGTLADGLAERTRTGHRAGRVLRAVPIAAAWWAEAGRHAADGRAFPLPHVAIAAAGLGALISLPVAALIVLRKLGISPDPACSVNDRTVFVIFTMAIGGIGTIEGPIVGTLIFLALRGTLVDLGTVCPMVLGAVAIVVFLKVPKHARGFLRARFHRPLFPLGCRVTLGPTSKEP